MHKEMTLLKRSRGDADNIVFTSFFSHTSAIVFPATNKQPYDHQLDANKQRYTRDAA